MSKTKNKKTETDDSDIGESMPFNAIDNSSDELQAGSDEKDSVKPAKTRKGGLGLAIAVLLSLAALAASGYLYLSQNSRSQQISSAISSLVCNQQPRKFPENYPHRSAKQPTAVATNS
jgi:hypothetical protein